MQSVGGALGLDGAELLERSGQLAELADRLSDVTGGAHGAVAAAGQLGLTTPPG
jgi:hypothetical protein